MTERARSGNVTLTIEMPVEVAQWFAANAEPLRVQVLTATAKAYLRSETCKKDQAERLQQRENYIQNLGRTGYRQLRSLGVHSNFVKNRDVTKIVASQLGDTWQTLEFAVTRFKRVMDAKLRKRRDREIVRLYEVGKNNDQISGLIGIHKSTVARIIRDYRATKTGRRA